MRLCRRLSWRTNFSTPDRGRGRIGSCIPPGFSVIGQHSAPIAQLDRVLPSEGKGRTFESCWVRQNSLLLSCFCPERWRSLRSFLGVQVLRWFRKIRKIAAVRRPQGRTIRLISGKNRGLNRFVGILLIATAVFPALPVFTTIKHTGFSRLGDWPDVIYGLALLSGVFVALGLRLIFVSRPLSSGVIFHNGGFAIRVRRSFGMRDEGFDWSDIVEVGLESFMDRASGGCTAHE